MSAATAAVVRVASPSAATSCDPESLLDAESRLVDLARRPVRLRRALARVAGRLVATRAWERLGFARLGDYALERAGISARELRDLARVDRSLDELKQLEAAFLSGQLAWTKLRLLCRVARAEDESQWLALASRLTARALAREVRAVDRRARGEGLGAVAIDAGEAPRQSVVIRCAPKTRAGWFHARQLAHRVAGQSLSVEAFVEVFTAEVLSAVALEAQSEPVPGEVPDETGAEGGRRRGPTSAAGSVPGPVEAWGPRPVSGEPPGLDLLAALDCELDQADAFELDARLRRAVRLEALQDALVGSALALVACHGLHRGLGFQSLDAYAEERLGIPSSRARALLRVERASQQCPALRRAWAQGRLSWVRANALLPLLLLDEAQPWRQAWVAHALRVSVRRLSDDVGLAMASQQLAPPALDPAAAPESESPVVPWGLQTGATPTTFLESTRLFFTASVEVAALFRTTLAAVQRRLEQAWGRPASEGDALDAMLAHVFDAWAADESLSKIPREHRVFARDGWRCTTPGCSSYRNLHGHHVVFRSAGGSDDLENLTTLCAWHHLRGVHAGTLRCSGVAPGSLRFELGVRPLRAPLVAYHSGDVEVDLPRAPTCDEIDP